MQESRFLETRGCLSHLRCAPAPFPEKQAPLLYLPWGGLRWGSEELRALWAQGQHLAHFHPCWIHLVAPFPTSGFSSLRKREWWPWARGARGWSFVGLLQPPHPQTLTPPPFSGPARKSCFFWTSPIEPCQEKIICRQGSGLFAGEQKDREEGSGKWKNWEQV